MLIRTSLRGAARRPRPGNLLAGSPQCDRQREPDHAHHSRWRRKSIHWCSGVARKNRGQPPLLSSVQADVMRTRRPYRHWSPALVIGRKSISGGLLSPQTGRHDKRYQHVGRGQAYTQHCWRLPWRTPVVEGAFAAAGGIAASAAVRTVINAKPALALPLFRRRPCPRTCHATAAGHGIAADGYAACADRDAGLFRLPDVFRPGLSPDGNHLAFLARAGGRLGSPSSMSKSVRPG